MASSTLTLVSDHLCPFVQRAAIVLAEKGAPFERINIDLAAKPDWFLAISPFGRVPLLKVRREDGSEAVLFESVAICEYLDESQPGVRLHPADLILRAQHRAWIEFAGTVLGDTRSFFMARDLAGAQAARSALRAKYERLEGVLAEGPYFTGPAFSMVDAVFAPILRYYDGFPDSVGAPIFDGLPKVAAWKAALKVRPSVVAAVEADFHPRFIDRLQVQQALLAA
jgi:glutathione S-transferase